MPTNLGGRVFTSWKEIAGFFGKGVRTVQRWETKFGLPISRPTAAKNVVLATESELREWIRRSSSQIEADAKLHDSANGDSVTELQISQITDRLKRLEEDTARLTRLVSSFTDRIENVGSPSNGDNAYKRVGTQVGKRQLAKPSSRSRT